MFTVRHQQQLSGLGYARGEISAKTLFRVELASFKIEDAGVCSVRPETDKLSLKTLSFSRAKREAQLAAMIGMVGELQGIMRQAMPEIAPIDGPQ